MFKCCDIENKKGEWEDIYGDPVRPRHHGYEMPPDVLQIGAWAGIFGLAILHFMIQIPFMKGALFIVVVVIGAVVLGGVVISKVILELYPQEDDAVFKKDVPRLPQEELEDDCAPEGFEPCVFCRRFVVEGCKHCSTCDKCVPGFDHHCRWLNSCVGDKNYYLFGYFMGNALVGCVWVVAWSFYTIIVALKDIDKFKVENMMYRAYWSPSNAFPAIIVFNFVALFLAGLGACGLTKLIVFHIYLRFYCHETTYAHIVNKRKKLKERGEYHGEPQKEGCCALKKRRDFKKYSKKNANNNNNDNDNNNNSGVVVEGGNVAPQQNFSSKNPTSDSGSDTSEHHEPV